MKQVFRNFLNLKQRDKAALLAFTLCIYALAVLYPCKSEGSNVFIDALSDGFHYPMFFMLTCLLFLTTFKTKPSYFKIGAAALCLGVATEIVQPLTGRSASIADLSNDVIGIIVALAACYVFIERPTSKYFFALFCLFCISTIVASMPAIFAYKQLEWQKTNFPVMGDFETAYENDLWQVYGLESEHQATAVASQDVSVSGKNSLKITTAPARWVGVYYDAQLFDWSRYSALTFSVFNPGKPFILHVRIDDKKAPDYDDRFNYSQKIQNGWNTVDIPIADIENFRPSRQFNVKQVRAMMIFVGANDMPDSFYLDNIRLK